MFFRLLISGLDLRTKDRRTEDGRRENQRTESWRRRDRQNSLVLQPFFILLVSLWATNAALADQAKAAHLYTVSVDPSLSELSVQGCHQVNDRRGLGYFRSGSGSAKNYLSETSKKYLRGNRLNLPVDTSGCFSYQVDLQTLRTSGSREIFSGHNNLVMATELWLWLPRNVRSESVELQFILPPGMRSSLPWPATGSNRYALNESPYYWPSFTALGHFERRMLSEGSSLIQVDYIGRDKQRSANQSILKKLTPWITRSAGATASVYGEFPRDFLQVLILPVTNSGEPVPFAQVTRRGHPALHFYINPNRPVEDFVADWTSYHEFSHLLIPFVKRSDAWLSEGLASYYQYLIMGRAGILDEQQSWQRLHRGITRGKQGMGKSEGMPLAEASADMGRYRAYRRVYWSGAIMWLEADLQLRTVDGYSSEIGSLDELLKITTRCCLTDKRSWRATELARALDQQLDKPLFTPLVNSYLKQHMFPDYRPLFAKLGITIVGSQLQFSDAPEQVELRRALLNKN